MSFSDIMDPFPDDSSSPYSPDALNFPEGSSVERFSRVRVYAVGVQPGMKDWNYPQVFSPFWRLYSNRGPGWRLRIGEQLYPLNEGQLMLVPSHLLFHCENDAPADHCWIHADVAAEWRSSIALPLQLDAAPFQQELLSQLIHAHQQQQYLATYSYARALLSSVLSQLPLPELQALPPGIQELIVQMEEAPGSIPSLSEAAKGCGLSERQIRRIFQQRFHQSPREFLSGCRLRLAAQRLRSSHDSLEEIAEHCGYADRFHFSKAFRNATGCPPARYRQQGLS